MRGLEPSRDRKCFRPVLPQVLQFDADARSQRRRLSRGHPTVLLHQLQQAGVAVPTQRFVRNSLESAAGYTP
jgi:hypothetical protein